MFRKGWRKCRRVWKGSDWGTAGDLLVDAIHEVAIDSRAALDVRLRGNESALDQ